MRALPSNSHQGNDFPGPSFAKTSFLRGNKNQFTKRINNQKDRSSNHREIGLFFVQKIPVAVGKYTLSFSCTRFSVKGELEALNRKYDAILVEVTTTKNTVGIARIDSKITVSKVN